VCWYQLQYYSWFVMGEPVTYRIFDTHVHVVSADLQRYPRTLLPNFSGGALPWYETALPVEALLEQMNVARVDHAVVVQPLGVYGFDNRCAVDSVDSEPSRLAAVVAVDPVSPGATGELLDWVTARKAAGLRLVVRTDTDREISDLVARAAELAIPVCVLATAEQLEIVRQLANCFPTIAFVIEHLAAATTMWGIPEESVDALCPLAAQPNVYLKVSTVNLAPIAGASDPIAGLEQLRGLYGASRLMWGSNYRASQGFDYPGMVKLAMRAVRDWSGGDQSFFLGETARTLWPALATRLTQGAEVS
jgi:L-fuconolactonase